VPSLPSVVALGTASSEYSRCPTARNNPTPCPAYQRSPVAFSTRPSRPAAPINLLHRGQTGRTSRRQEAVSLGSPGQTVSAHFPEGAGREQKWHTLDTRG
jgi:hypothetical protein